MKFNTAGFSIIEVMIGIFVFTLGLTSIFLMLSGTITMSDYSRNLIIASNLASEEIELFKNIRDSNYMKVKNWSQINPSLDYDVNALFEKGSYYTFENSYNMGADFPIKVKEISNFSEGKDEVMGKMQDYRLCLNDEKLFTYDCTGSNEKTNFYRYTYISDVEYDDGSGNIIIENAFKITSKVIWVHRGYFSTELSTIVADWKKL